jgi:hypothetical protein
MNERNSPLIMLSDTKHYRHKKTKTKRKMTAIAIILMLCATIVTGAVVVNYLSNKQSSVVDVDKPLLFQISETKDGPWEATEPITFDANATEKIMIYTKVEKLAGNNEYYADKDVYGVGWNGAQIAGTFMAAVTNPDGVNITAFQDIVATFYDNEGYMETISFADGFFEWYKEGQTLYIHGPTYIKWDQWGYFGDLEITFGQYAQGTYLIEMWIE